MRALEYAFTEALASLRRGGQGGLLATATIALALFVLGAFLMLSANLERLGEEWGSAAEMSVYLADDATGAARAAIEAALAPGDLVTSREFVSKTDALTRFRQTFKDLASSIDTLGENPLPASYEVRLRSGSGTSAAMESLSARLRQLPGVADVQYDRQWLDRLLSAVAVVRGMGLVLSLVLTVAAALTVANVVRLALFARRDELEIMELVGAPSAYLRGPFVMEGVLQGGLGAVLALIALAAAFFVVRARYVAPLAAAIDLPAVQFLPAVLCVAVVLGGMAVGCLGGMVAARGRG
ncbi:MAG TPA: ABC transporter permease [Vicinamibacterales bacterium]|nr:ABC transporter permease [Vicinamibacterales bacterium]